MREMTMENVFANNDQALEAWNDWKKSCAVDRCSAENKFLLQREIGSAFRKKLQKIVSVPGGNDEEYKKYAHEFDIGIFQYAEMDRIHRKTGEVLAKKKYKNMVWEAVAKSEEPPLKVIRGMLISAGNVLNPLEAIVEEYARMNYGISRKTRNVELFSINDTDGQKASNDIPDERSEKSEMASEDKKFFVKRIGEEFSWQEAAVLLHFFEHQSMADASGSLDDPALLYRIGVGKSQAYVIRNTALTKLRIIFEAGGYSRNDSAMLEILDLVKKELKSLLKKRKK